MRRARTTSRRTRAATARTTADAARRQPWRQRCPKNQAGGWHGKCGLDFAKPPVELKSGARKARAPRLRSSYTIEQLLRPRLEIKTGVLGGLVAGNGRNALHGGE